MQKNILFCLLFLSWIPGVFAQWAEPDLPIVDTLQYVITDTVYMSPTGDDQNLGTANSPVLTFERATEILPYTTIHNYGLVILLPGDYYPTEIMQQWPIEWQRDFNNVTHYKNISVLGQGNVVIHGDSLTVPSSGSALLTVKGSHIFVKNITLTNSPGFGLRFTFPYEPRYASMVEIQTERSQHLIVEDVLIDGAENHGLLAKYVDHILVQNCEVRGTSKSFWSSGQTQWGGAIKFDFSSNIICRNNYVHENDGEGINLSLTYNSLSESNTLHDNRASHIYSMNAKRALIRNNLTYTTVFDSTYWHPITRRVATGISIRNEFEWTTGFNPGFLHPTGGRCDYILNPALNQGQILGDSTRMYVGFPCASIPPIFIESNTDSIAVYNNVVLNAGNPIAINDASTAGLLSQFGELSWFSNIFIHHNTCYGWSGDTSSINRMMSVVQKEAFFGIPISYAENVQIHDNVFLLDPADTAQINWFNVSDPAPYTFTNNVWNGDPESGNVNGTSSQFSTHVQISHFPAFAAPDSLEEIDPSCIMSLQVLPFSVPPYLFYDYRPVLRNTPSMVGALEFQPGCLTGLEAPQLFEPILTAYPIPTQGTLRLTSRVDADHLHLSDALGRTFSVSDLTYVDNETVLNLQTIPPGLYLLSVVSGQQRTTVKFIKN